MQRAAKVRVHYPLASGRLVLRVSNDWERDVAPAAANRARTRFDYEIDLADAPFAYFKPVLLGSDREAWAQGGNYLALPDGRREVFPHFFSEPKCNVCRLVRKQSRDGDRAHGLRVFTPPGYHENMLARYPVLYMHDGQNLFFPEEAFQGETWRVEETLKHLDAMNLVRQVIVVGVHPGDRMTDYTQPGYGEFGRYLAQEIKPWIDASYRTLAGPEHTGVVGSSLGGVISLYLGWQHPEVFGLVGCLSSTFGWRDDLMARVTREAKRPLRIYLDSGWPGDNFEATLFMRNALRERGYVEGRDLNYVAFPNAKHDERAWAARLHQPLQFFFGAG
jgi:enterochelin esterase-like enzyme